METLILRTKYWKKWCNEKYTQGYQSSCLQEANEKFYYRPLKIKGVDNCIEYESNDLREIHLHLKNLMNNLKS